MHGRATIFMLHRFQHPELVTQGHEPQTLRELLSYLRRSSYSLLPLEQLFSALRDGTHLPQRAVVFTLDDGYLDQAIVAAPIFAEFDCPVTTFVTTGFVDGKIWQWWDQIEFILLNTERPALSASLAGRQFRYPLADHAERRLAAEDFAERCKEVTSAEARIGIIDLAQQAEVDLPESAPLSYAPMSWTQLRACEERGMTVAPHTVSHPLLSQTSDDESRREIAQSWERLRTEAQRPIAIFAYPNGRSADFGRREIETIRDLGLRGAVTGEPGYASAHAIGESDDGPYRVARFPYSDSLPLLIYTASGAGRLEQLLTGG
jgi:peptidoglycan/xylan/chitin deacetylase (PgdA/CDA1 family)